MSEVFKQYPVHDYTHLVDFIRTWLGAHRAQTHSVPVFFENTPEAWDKKLESYEKAWTEIKEDRQSAEGMTDATRKALHEFVDHIECLWF